jgi:hexosaminidase
MEALLKEHGRVMIGWDEILEGGVSPSTIVMSWRGTEGGIAAANAGNDVIMTPHKFCYINGIQSPDLAKEPPLGTRHPTRPHHRPLDVAYMYDPYDGVPADNHKHIIGLQACLWTEHVKIMPHALYMTLPRLSALAETGWSLAPKDFGRYLESLENLCKYYKFYEYPYSRSYWRDNGLD